MNKLYLQAIFGGDSMESSMFPPKERSFALAKMQAVHREVVAAFEAQREQVARDLLLSEQGQADSLRKYVAATLEGDESVARSREQIASAEDELANLRAEETAATRRDEGELSTVDALRRVFAETEARTHLLGLDVGGRIEAWYESVERGDEVLHRAFVEAPPYLQPRLFSGIDDDIREQGINRWRAKHAPEASKATQSLEGVLRETQRSHQVMERHLRQEVGLDVSSLLTQDASGRQVAVSY